jgi:hypothetical protein
VTSIISGHLRLDVRIAGIALAVITRHNHFPGTKFWSPKFLACFMRYLAGARGQGNGLYLCIGRHGFCIQAKSIHWTATTEEIENISFMYAPPTRAIKVDVPVKVRPCLHSLHSLTERPLLTQPRHALPSLNFPTICKTLFWGGNLLTCVGGLKPIWMETRSLRVRHRVRSIPSRQTGITRCG